MYLDDEYVKYIQPWTETNLKGVTTTFTLLQAAYHRNGSGGTGYRLAILEVTREDGQGDPPERVVVGMFEDGEDAFALDIDVLNTEAGIAFGHNSYRATDWFLRPFTFLWNEHEVLRMVSRWGSRPRYEAEIEDVRPYIFSVIQHMANEQA